ncbi:MAG: hypothetical protein ACOX5S_02810 [Patescibacteria group bacterium]|jgi:hypothetical protein
MYFKLNKDSIIFLDSDAQEGYKTIAYDWKNDKILEISPPLYHILKALDSSGSATEEDLEKWINTFSANDNSVKKAIADLIEREIINKYEY